MPGSPRVIVEHPESLAITAPGMEGHLACFDGIRGFGMQARGRNRERDLDRGTIGAIATEVAAVVNHLPGGNGGRVWGGGRCEMPGVRCEASGQ